jgi:hypothetical protein
VFLPGGHEVKIIYVVLFIGIVTKIKLQYPDSVESSEGRDSTGKEVTKIKLQYPDSVESSEGRDSTGKESSEGRDSTGKEILSCLLFKK